jgi:hypothetical protein
VIAPKTLKMGKIIGTIKKTMLSRFNFGIMISSEKNLFRMYAIIQETNRKAFKLINRGISESGLSIPTKGKIQLINNPPNIKKAILNPIV